MDAEQEKRFRFRARYEAEQAQQTQQAQPQPGMIRKGLEFVGRQVDRVSAGPLRGAEEGIQNYQPEGNGSFHPGVIGAALKGAGRGFMNPDQVQPGQQMFARMGASTDPTSQLNVMGTSGRPMSLGQDRPAGDPSTAATLGALQDMITPIPGAGLLRAGGKLAKAAGGDKALSAAAAPVRSAAGQLASKFEAGGNRIQQTVLRPRAGDWNSGAKIENIPKYGIQGGVDDVINGADAQIKAASDKLREAIQAGADEGATVDLDAILDATKAKIKATGRQDLVSAIDPIFANFRKWAKVAGERSGNAGGKANLLEAQQFKQTIGAHGAWEKTAAGRNSKVQDTFQSKAAQQVYLEMKDAIEAAAPEGVKELNKTLSDLIPIRNAAVYRKIVADRNNPIGLGDMLSAMTAIGNGPAGAAMLAASKFTTKGFGAKTMYSISKTLKGLSESKSAAEAKFYLAKLEKEKMDKAEIADYLTEMRRPLDLNPPAPPRRAMPTGARRPLDLQFGPETAPIKKKFDPLDMLVGEPGQGGSGLPGIEGMAPPELAARKAAEAQASREAFIRQGREPRSTTQPVQPGGVKVLNRSDVAIRPRTPKGEIQSNFPPQYVENPKVAQVLDAVPGRRQLTTESDKIKGLKAELEAATTNEARQRILAKLRAENYRIPLTKGKD